MSAPRTAQVTMEFTILVGLAFLFLLGMLVAVQSYAASYRASLEAEELGQWVAVLRRELLLAASVRDGYTREVQLPSTIKGTSYTINNTDGSVTLTLTDGRSATQLTPDYTGSFHPGTNTIRKRQGIITVTPS